MVMKYKLRNYDRKIQGYKSAKYISQNIDDLSCLRLTVDISGFFAGMHSKECSRNGGGTDGRPELFSAPPPDINSIPKRTPLFQCTLGLQKPRNLEYEQDAIFDDSFRHIYRQVSYICTRFCHICISTPLALMTTKVNSVAK